MKIRFFFLFLICILPISAFILLSFFHLEEVYDFTPAEHISHISWDTVVQVHTDNAYNIWYLGIPKEQIEEAHLASICIDWHVSGNVYQECLDDDGVDLSDEYYSFPVQTPHTDVVAFQLTEPLSVETPVTIYSLNTDPVGSRLVFGAHRLHAEDWVISRAEWGADESLRYADHPEHQKRFERARAAASKPQTPAQIADLQYRKNANAFLRERNDPATQTAQLIRTENGHELVWPIETVKQVNRIIVHHTAMSFKPGQSDEAMLRAIYAYHTLNRGWGDIGYNYLIGQNGQIYEGRAGGDYVVGAHAVYNNMGSVGISVMWDFNKMEMTPEQELGLKRAIDMNVKKYGINLSESVVSYRMCRTADCSFPLRAIPMPAIIGHQDVQATSCPGVHIYPKLWGYIRDLHQTTSPILNTGLFHIPTASAQANEIKADHTLTSNALSRHKVMPAAYFGKKMRVKLSYPHANQITLSSYDGTPGTAFLNHERHSLASPTTLSVTPVGNDRIQVRIGDSEPQMVSHFSFSAPVVSIDSWTRVPEWDKNSQYNDNLFRDTIEVYNENGALVVINHLPLEWYLKGLWEVSNGDLPEKIKTITVAARTYALYYMDRENRKYNTHKYDGSDDPDSFQKYIGYSYELRSPNVARMVDQTRNQVIRYQGELIKPWYFSRSDGRTLSALEYCQNRGGTQCEDIPYLQSVSDPGGVGYTRSWHGVGISGIGATHFAREGWDYRAIIQYYLTGVEITL